MEARGPRGRRGRQDAGRRCLPGTEAAACGLHSHLYLLIVKKKCKSFTTGGCERILWILKVKADSKKVSNRQGLQGDVLAQDTFVKYI